MQKIKENHKDLYISYCENVIDRNIDVVCSVCELQGTHCEGRRCEESYTEYTEGLEIETVLKEVYKDCSLRNMYNSMSISEKIRFKKYIYE